MASRRKYALIWLYSTDATDVVPITNLTKNHRVAGADTEINKNKVRVLSVGGECVGKQKN